MVFAGQRLLEEAAERYAAASGRVGLAQRAWEAADCPMTLTFPNGVEGVHPLLKVVLDAEAHADRLGRSLEARVPRAWRHRGRRIVG
jgi:hypothetical protein